MRVSLELGKRFDGAFEDELLEVAVRQGWANSVEELASDRTLKRSLVPHLAKLSQNFNNPDEGGLGNYWRTASNPNHVRLAYFLFFMPCNLVRVASVFEEMRRVGVEFPFDELRAVEFGAGQGAGAAGVGAGWGQDLPGSYALVERDRNSLDVAQDFLPGFLQNAWELKPFHRTLDLKRGWLPRSAPSFNLWLTSFFLNELKEKPTLLAESLMKAWERHLEPGGLVVFVEPALKRHSRKLLELRKAILERNSKNCEMRVLLPCLGNQACGALAEPEDWCHEVISWWRPPRIKRLDQMLGLDHKTLPFSYLVLQRGGKGLGVGGSHRLVSPAFEVGSRHQEYYLCGPDGKWRARSVKTEPLLQRGDILKDVQAKRGEHLGVVESFESFYNNEQGEGS